ncbi:MAG: polyketide synthase, partial [Kofleriaceae bacterium]
ARAFANALRVEAGRFIAEVARELADLLAAEVARFAEDLRRAYEKQFAASPHDRPGEMASTIAGRVTMAFKLRGRSAVVEAADATSVVAIREAVLGLRAGASELAIVVAGQRIESGLLVAALDAKGLLGYAPSSPFERDGGGVLLGEGVGALVLKRLSSAERDGDRVYALIRGIAARHAPQPGSFRYPSNADTRVASLQAACADAGVAPTSLQYIECFGVGDTALELEALKRAVGHGEDEIALGCVKQLFGHTMANAGMLALTKVALALDRRELPGQPSATGDPLPLAPPFAVPSVTRAWPDRGDGPRRAAIGGCSLTGSSWHVIVEGYDPPRVPRSPRSTPAAKATPIAIVGFGGRVGKAHDAVAFWDDVASARDSIERVSTARLDRDVYFDPANPDLLKSYCELGSTIEDTELARGRFTIPPRRLEYMDAVQRVALTVADEALQRYGRTPTGAGAVWFATNLALNAERQANTWLHYRELEGTFDRLPGLPSVDAGRRRRILRAVRERLRRDARAICGHSLDGYLASGVAAVIANELRLHAPPVAMEAACASSLGAIDAAMRGLAQHEYDYAVTGGIELPVNTRDLVLCSSLGLLSPRRIAPFDAAADGFTIGEAAVAFVLKRHADAVHDGDPIYAVLRSVGASSDAKSLIAPDVDGQALALARAFEAVDFGPETIQYVEAHGTGTALGDPTEIRALARVYGGHERSAPLAIGSAKSMVGHTFAAAGAVGLLRTILAMRAGTLPPSTHVTTINPKLPLQDIPAYIATGVAPWPVAKPRRAAVSAFGTGGMNYHVLVEDGDPER